MVITEPSFEVEKFVPSFAVSQATPSSFEVGLVIPLSAVSQAELSSFEVDLVMPSFAVLGLCNSFMVASVVPSLLVNQLAYFTSTFVTITF